MKFPKVLNKNVQQAPESLNSKSISPTFSNNASTSRSRSTKRYGYLYLKVPLASIAPFPSNIQVSMSSVFHFQIFQCFSLV